MIYQQASIVSMYEFSQHISESLLHMLQSHGASIEDIILEAFRATLCSNYVIPQDRFELYIDTNNIEHGYDVVAGSVGTPFSKNDVMTKFVDTVYLLYVTNFSVNAYLLAPFMGKFDMSDIDVEFSQMQWIGQDFAFTLDIIVNPPEH